MQALLIILGEEEFDVTKTAHFQSWLNTVRISKSALRASRNFDFENFDPNSTDAQIKALDQYLQSIISLFSFKFWFKTEELNSQTIVYEIFMLIHHKNIKYSWKQKIIISLTPSKNLQFERTLWTISGEITWNILNFACHFSSLNDRFLPLIESVSRGTFN